MKGSKKITGVNLQYETVSPATKLLEKRRKMYEVHEAFQAQKQQYKKDQQKFQDVEKDIRKRDLDIQMQLVEFCHFLQENETKRKKAEERLKIEEKANLEKDVQIQKLKTQCQELTRHQRRLEVKVAALRKYEEYLQKVKNTYPDQYSEMNDILSRHHILDKSNAELIKQLKAIQKNHEALKVESNNFEKQLNQAVLQLSNQTKDLARRLEERINERNELQSEVENSNQLASRKNLVLGKILMAIDNLFYRCSEGSQRIKHEYEEYKLEKKLDPKKTLKPSEVDKNKKKDDALEDDADYEVKSKAAAQKLKSIFSYMKDFKTILDEYKKEKVNMAQKKN